MSAFSEQIWELPPDLSPALLHGTVCGLLCGAPDESVRAYRRTLNDLLDESAQVDAIELGRFIEYAADDLASPEYAFAPLLPDDDQPLTERVEALALWSAGFLLGFEQAAGELDDEAADALEDVERIAEVGGDVDDDDEFDFFSVAEHLKVAVLTIYEATRPEEDADDDDDE